MINDTTVPLKRAVGSFGSVSAELPILDRLILNTLSIRIISESALGD